MFTNRDFTTYALWGIVTSMALVVVAGLVFQTIGVEVASGASTGADGTVGGFKFVCPLH